MKTLTTLPRLVARLRIGAARRALLVSAVLALPTGVPLAAFVPATARAEFGIVPGSFGAGAFEEDGTSPYTQAGGHPYSLKTGFTFNLSSEPPAPDQNVKDVIVDLPPGLVGNPAAVPQCPLEQSSCPTDSQVGMADVVFSSGTAHHTFPVYNAVPAPGEAAAFTFLDYNVWTHVGVGVRTGGDYGVRSVTRDISEKEALNAATLTIWGVPGDPSHDADRGLICNPGCSGGGQPFSGLVVKPFLRAPTRCGSPDTISLSVDSWQEPGIFPPASLSTSPALLGCDRVPFEPSLTVTTERSAADTPSGLHVDLHMPQPEATNTLGEADLKKAVVTLPPGVVVNPSSAGGLEGCSPAQIELHGAEAAQCPDGSKIGTVEVDTPLLEHPLKGGVYVATPGDNPFGSLLAIYVAVNDPETGIVVKLAGHVQADPLTGQLTTTFDENPQLPFEDFKLDFFGGSHAALVTPPTCGSFTTTADMTPWTSPYHGDVAPPVEPFAITSGPNGSACLSSESQQPNTTSFEAGTVNPAAGAYSPFVLHLVRQDGSQRLRAIDVTLPPGLAGKIAGVEECSDAAIAQARSREGVLGAGALEQSSPSCPAGSLLGTATVTAGAGPDPYPVTGKAYFAGPYAGAPFSVAIVTPAVAGPYDLGTVVVRSALFIDPKTAQVTVKSDPIPTILDGIPLDVRSIDVDVSRSQFTFNPTSCAPMSVAGAVTSAADATAAVSDRFQVGGCRALAFNPGFHALTHATHTRANGDYLHVAVTSGSGQANIAKVHVQLPKRLPSRLSTLKLACTEAQFAANPAGCPAGSFVGTATAYTPVLPVPLSGPAIFVSHGGAAFPDLDIVLQGDGVTVILTGNTFISRAGITSSTFASVPDVPVSRFDLVLPVGPHSALTGTGNLCSRVVTMRKRVRVRIHGRLVSRTRTGHRRVRVKLTMPTTITGQNGAVIRRSTKLAVSGCPKASGRAPTS